MSGTRFLFITKDLQIYKVPMPRNYIYKAIPSLHNQDVLKVILHYETENRKPSKLVLVSFQRLTLDHNGQYELTNDEIREGSRNFIEFAYHTPESLSETDQPLPIPTPVALPTQLEKDCLKAYIKKNMPQLVGAGFYIIEREVESRKKINLEHKNLVLNASKLRRKKGIKAYTQSASLPS
ncbi:hypothetical protein [Fusibacter sp. 3D3]|uniref:hypothetical protein n=1 Tax=Fusibacter sp. 3D3 TaxID=1048380 RepID=UPI000852D44B|nr:hypothetical protein [Fusibacter sp. 3D3]GAU75433.1 hypothetical protein F3D3_0019 [Fusibacter sp. 3D3]